MNAPERVRIVEADWIWTGRAFEPNLQIEISADGKIRSIHRKRHTADLQIEDAALIPGFVNAHSHAFQRGLRGYGETFPEGSGSFWNWRNQMYELVNSIDSEIFYSFSLQAFREMLRCGITTVGEFHYLHHQSLDEDYSLDEVLLQAAEDAGIRIVLISVYYREGGIGNELAEAQLRFRTSSLAGYWEQMERLERRVRARPKATLGVAAHSIRAVAPEELMRLHARAASENRVFHMHLEEQEKEIEDCRKAYGLSPMRLVAEQLAVGEHFTAVHATHTSRADLKRFLEAGGNVCTCPTTEGNLGDGIADLAWTKPGRWRFCVGTDSNTRISINEELRWLEYLQRVQNGQRGVFLDEEGSVARRLLAVGSQNGARALGVPSGNLMPGNWADLVAIDLLAEDLVGWQPETVLASFLLGADACAVRGVMVGGRWTSF